MGKCNNRISEILAGTLPPHCEKVPLFEKNNEKKLSDSTTFYTFAL